MRWCGRGRAKRENALAIDCDVLCAPHIHARYWSSDRLEFFIINSSLFVGEKPQDIENVDLHRFVSDHSAVLNVLECAAVLNVLS